MATIQFYIIKRDGSTPRDLKGLHEWVSNQIESTPAESQDDKNILCTLLRKCYKEMLKEFPALNGRDATDDDEMIDKALDYYLSRNAIMVDCTDSLYSPALQYATDIAKKYGLCIYCTILFTILSDENNTTASYVTRHHINDYPTLWKAIILSFKTPIFVSAIIFAVYYIIKYLCTLNPLPHYLPSIHISSATMAIFTFLLGVFLFIIGVRNERRGKTMWYDETVTVRENTVASRPCSLSNVHQTFS